MCNKCNDLANFRERTDFSAAFFFLLAQDSVCVKGSVGVHAAPVTEASMDVVQRWTRAGETMSQARDRVEGRPLMAMVPA